METFILSSDSSGDEEGPPPKKIRKSIEGIPKNFDNDRRIRFSFGVSDISMINSPGPSSSSMLPKIPEYSETPPPKTPQSLRRRSISMTNFTPKVQKNFEKSVFSREKEYDFNNLSSDEEEEKTEISNFKNSEISENLKALISPEKKKRKEKIEEVQNEFFGVYCLISRSDRPCYKNRCYIGYTVDPNRRIMQHNGGREKGGAKKTDSRGPWDMVCVVHGFPNHVAALRFEWAWQNPNVSKAIKERNLKKERKETPFAYQLRIACELMNSEVFNRFALTFRWLMTSEELPFPSSCQPPSHVKLRYGKVKKEMSLVPSKKEQFVEMGECRICGKDIQKLWSLVRCTSSACPSHFHSSCLSENGLKSKNEYSTQVFPLKSSCPTCGHPYLWGDVIREQRRIIKISTKCSEEFRNMVVRKDLAHREISPTT